MDIIVIIVIFMPELLVSSLLGEHTDSYGNMHMM